MKLGKWRTVNESVKVSRRHKHEFDKAINDLLARGYKIKWQHPTMCCAELVRGN